MRITLISFDTRGGIQPYIALGLGLKRAGHAVALAAPENFEGFVKGYGLEYRRIEGDMEAEVRASAALVEKGTLAAQAMALREMKARTGPRVRDALAACEGAELVLGGVGGMMLGEAAAEKLGVPFVQAHLQPLSPTRELPGILAPWMPRGPGGWLHLLSHALSDAALWMPFHPAMKAAREEVLGLPRRKPRAGPRPVLYGFSRHVIAPPRDWGSHLHVTGYWTLPAQADWAPPPELKAFLEAGPPPVCIGFGSMVSQSPEQTTRLVLEAVKRAGVRAVLLSGWGALKEQTRLPASVFAAEALPHDWLYPRMAAVVHHGGAGTTGAALRAGVPAVVVPFTMDQPYWGRRVMELGAGPRPIARKRLTAERLATALRTAVSDEAMRRRAAALGERIRAEDGVTNAVRALEQILEALRRPVGLGARLHDEVSAGRHGSWAGPS